VYLAKTISQPAAVRPKRNLPGDHDNTRIVSGEKTKISDREANQSFLGGKRKPNGGRSPKQADAFFRKLHLISAGFIVQLGINAEWRLLENFKVTRASSPCWRCGSRQASILNNFRGFSTGWKPVSP
jgi:hypothetical protein